MKGHSWQLDGHRFALSFLQVLLPQLSMLVEVVAHCDHDVRGALSHSAARPGVFQMSCERPYSGVSHQKGEGAACALRPSPPCLARSLAASLWHLSAKRALHVCASPAMVF